MNRRHGLCKTEGGVLHVGPSWCRGLEMGTSLVYLRKEKKARVGGMGGRVAERSGTEPEARKTGLECSSDCKRQPWVGVGRAFH